MFNIIIIMYSNFNFVNGNKQIKTKMNYYMYLMFQNINCHKNSQFQKIRGGGDSYCSISIDSLFT